MLGKPGDPSADLNGKISKMFTPTPNKLPPPNPPTPHFMTPGTFFGREPWPGSGPSRTWSHAQAQEARVTRFVLLAAIPTSTSSDITTMIWIFVVVQRTMVRPSSCVWKRPNRETPSWRSVFSTKNRTGVPENTCAAHLSARFAGRSHSQATPFYLGTERIDRTCKMRMPLREVLACNQNVSAAPALTAAAPANRSAAWTGPKRVPVYSGVDGCLLGDAS